MEKFKIIKTNNQKEKMQIQDKINKEKEKIPQDILERDFLNDKITLNEFKNKIIELDQTGDHTKEAKNNIKLLENPKIKEKIWKIAEQQKEVSEIIKEKYWLLLSLSYFHHSQNVFSIDYFKKAFQYAENTKEESWKEYTKGTLGYFQKDIEKIKESIKNINNTTKGLKRNKKILKNLLESLKNNEEPNKENYLIAYLKN